jgi:aminoglycoside phosphotransferase (APT) family kinase protein
MHPTSDINIKVLNKYISSIAPKNAENNVVAADGPLENIVIRHAEKFSGGQSNPTYLLHSNNGKLVLRRKPSGVLLKSAHAIDREFTVAKALQDTAVPVANMYHYSDDLLILGSEFYLMEYIDGEVFWDPALPHFSNEQRSHIYKQMNEVLSKLHKLNPVAIGLESFGKAGNYYERQINRWTHQYHASQTNQIDDMETLIQWLNDNMPKDDGKISLVHGDFRLDNIMWCKNTHKPLAVVDWELSTLGHPLADLAYQCMQWRMPHDCVFQGLGGLNREKLGIPSEQEYVNEYCKSMGWDTIENWKFYLTFSFFRIAAILQGVKKRAQSDNASSDKAKAMGKLVVPIAKMAVDLLKD